MAKPISNALAAWRSTGAYSRYQGHSVFYRAGGDWGDSSRPVLTLLHGFPTASWDWSRLWDVLCRQDRVLALDFLGFGFSDKPQGYAYSIADQADRVEHLLAARGVTHTHLLAHDYGDTVAQELMARHLQRERNGEPGLRLLSVCLLNGGLFPETHRPRLVQRLLAGPAGSLVAGLMNRRGFGRQFSAIFGSRTRPQRQELDDFWSLITHNDGRAVMPRLIGYMAERRRQRERWVEALALTAVPVRVINGLDDPVSGGHMLVRLRERVPDVDIVELHCVGHYPQWEVPEAVRDAYRQFRARGAAGR